MNEILQDLRYAFRAMRRAPAFSAIAIFCLAMGIGVNAAAFGVLDALLLRDYPGVERTRELSTILVSYETKWGRSGAGVLSVQDWELFHNGMPGFSSSSVAGTSSVALKVAGEPRAVRGDFVSGEFFTMLRTRPAAGRLLSPSDDAQSASPAVVIGYDVWQREFDGRTDVVGKSLVIGTHFFTVVGVAPKGFVGLNMGDLVADPEHGAPYVFLPLSFAPLVRVRSTTADMDDRWLSLVGRRQPRVSTAQIGAQANAIASQIGVAYPQDRRNARAQIGSTNSGASVAETMMAVAFVMATPLLILLIACANLANQLLARAVQRSREIAVRLSLGATRARLVRQLLVESSALALMAGAAGVVIAFLFTRVLSAFFLVMPFDIPIDERVLAFTICLALLTSLAFGLWPALSATRADLATAVKDGGRTGGYRRSRLRNALVVTQVAASVALLALAGVFMRASERSRVTGAEGNATHMLTVDVNLDLLGYTQTSGSAFQTSAMERLHGLPGVEAVALAPFGPLGSIPERRASIASDAADYVRYADVVQVTGDWFGTWNIRALNGRVFTETEAHNGAPIAVTDEFTARRFWPKGNAVGQSVRIGDSASAASVTIVGVIPTILRKPQDNPDDLFIVPWAGGYDAQAKIYVRTKGDAAAMRAPIRDGLRAIDPRLPIASVTTLGESFEQNAEPVKQLASGVGAMGSIALLLAALGLFGVLSFIVAQRQYEIGVRIALGARATAVTWMILRQSLMLSTIGIVIGAGAAAATATLLRSMLYGLPPIDPIAFAGSTGIILAVALLASFAPARRAARVDPIVALRAE